MLKSKEGSTKAGKSGTGSTDETSSPFVASITAAAEDVEEEEESRAGFSATQSVRGGGQGGEASEDEEVEEEEVSHGIAVGDGTALGSLRGQGVASGSRACADSAEIDEEVDSQAAGAGAAAAATGDSVEGEGLLQACVLPEGVFDAHGAHFHTTAVVVVEPVGCCT